MSFLRSLVVSIGAIAAAFGVGSGCSPKEDPPRNGVNDVRKACEIRATWKRSTERVCLNCVSAAPAAACDCPDFKAFGGLCKSQDDARRGEPSCTDAVGNCSRACANDCTCVESCYAQAEACKRAAAAEDGCIADVCDQYCK